MGELSGCIQTSCDTCMLRPATFVSDEYCMHAAAVIELLCVAALPCCRYCPSIEDKIVRFADKDSHQIFLEPEGRTTPELYVQVSVTACFAHLHFDILTWLGRPHVVSPMVVPISDVPCSGGDHTAHTTGMPCGMCHVCIEHM
jgi:hypothetical protein